MNPQKAINPQEFDPSIRPTDDFFKYVNSRWIAGNPIPANESRWGSFLILRFKVEEQIKKIFDELEHADEDKLEDTAKKVKKFYQSGMDVEKRNRLKDEPL